MNKKKVGELEGTPIVIGKKNYANEHEYYLTMNEDNTYLKLELRVSGDLFRLVLGGGSNNYPTVTAGDVNKVWQVTPIQKGTKTEETVIVPEQTLVEAQVLEYNDKFVPGAQCVATINGVEYRGEVVEENGNKGTYYVLSLEDFDVFTYNIEEEIFEFWNFTELPEVTAKLSVIEETPIYDYNWAPGVKIPIPTAEDEGKILVVTKVDGSNTSIIVPEQQVPADNETPLTNVDLTKFIVGNTVRVTVTYESEDPSRDAKSADSQIFTATGVIEDDGGLIVTFDFDGDELEVWQIDNSLYTNANVPFGSDATIKLEYGEPSYEYQLQENSGGGSESGFKYNELPEPTVTREVTEEDLSKLPTSNYLPANSSYGNVIDLDNGLIPDKLVLLNNNYYEIMYLYMIDTNGGGAEGVIWVLYNDYMYVVSADGSIMARIERDDGLS